MKFYFAPMEGITGYIYRNAHHTFFNSADKYFSPFIVANQSVKFKTREINDILPENNTGLFLVPQLLTNHAKDFIAAANKINQLGYNEINLNLGCPAATVVSKNKGSGFLSKKEELNAFLDEIYSNAVTKISVKTRIGKDDPKEFYDLIRIFNQYPIEELIIHPRIQKDFYNNKPNLKIFKDALALSKNPVCYNGDIFSKSDYNIFVKDFPEVKTLMLGRGLLRNPALIKDITNQDKTDKNVWRKFHDTICEDYRNTFSGDKNVLYKMKELWFYLGTSFTDYEKYIKKIKKTEKLCVYEEIVKSLFEEQDLAGIE